MESWLQRHGDNSTRGKAVLASKIPSRENGGLAPDDLHLDDQARREIACGKPFTADDLVHLGVRNRSRYRAVTIGPGF